MHIEHILRQVETSHIARIAVFLDVHASAAAPFSRWKLVWLYRCKEGGGHR